MHGNVYGVVVLILDEVSSMFGNRKLKRKNLASIEKLSHNNAPRRNIYQPPPTQVLHDILRIQETTLSICSELSKARRGFLYTKE